MLAPMVEKPDIVVAVLQRLDFFLNKIVQHRQIFAKLLWDLEIHLPSSPDVVLKG